jgi:hypothetical protein
MPNAVLTSRADVNSKKKCLILDSEVMSSRIGAGVLNSSQEKYTVV